MADEQATKLRKESAMLIIGVILGALFSVIVNLWSAYFIEWYKSISPTANPDWTLLFVGTSILLVALTVYLVFWAKKRLL